MHMDVDGAAGQGQQAAQGARAGAASAGAPGVQPAARGGGLNEGQADLSELDDAWADESPPRPAPSQACGGSGRPHRDVA